MTPPRPRVLFVDDDEAVCRSMARCLERAGIAVTTVGNGPDAVVVLQAERFDVVVTDHQMPGMSGAELVLQLTASDRTMASRIILTSGDIDGTETAQAIRQSGCRSLAKPYAPVDLVMAIKAAIGPAGALTAA